MTDIASGKFRVSQIRDVDINDLLGREAIQLDTDLIEAFIKGKNDTGYRRRWFYRVGDVPADMPFRTKAAIACGTGGKSPVLYRAGTSRKIS